MKYFPLLLIAYLTFSCEQENKKKNSENTEQKVIFTGYKKLKFSPRQYVVYKTPSPIVIDGMANEESWQQVPFTKKFVDIEGDTKPSPQYDTRAKILWNDNYLYIFAELYESHIWANLKKRDTIIYYDNDFEVFIDPDGDTHGYYEYEVNALNTVWDLLLIKPYRDGGPPINNWDINGLKSAVMVYGTLNNSSDTDDKWTIEIAFPLSVLNEFNSGDKPADKVQWRINFSRVEWEMKIMNGKYVKKTDPETGKPLPEHNWVWSPQEVVNMHQPETWGFIQFSENAPGTKNVKFIYNNDEDVKWELRSIYYAQKAYIHSTGKWADNINELRKTGLDVDDLKYFKKLETTSSLFEATASGKNSKFAWHIDNTGRVWKTTRQK
ncbi:MAG: carbohydrate-binding family 9-like protein [Chlorobi bacterium]|nr:carbohydrate-binding family 9-like protein [Chlorobiota bacterium]